MAVKGLASESAANLGQLPRVPMNPQVHSNSRPCHSRKCTATECHSRKCTASALAVQSVLPLSATGTVQSVLPVQYNDRVLPVQTGWPESSFQKDSWQSVKLHCKGFSSILVTKRSMQFTAKIEVTMNFHFTCDPSGSHTLATLKALVGKTQ